MRPRKMTAQEKRIWDAAYGAAFVQAAGEYKGATGRGWSADHANESAEDCAGLATMTADAAVRGLRSIRRGGP